MLEKKEIKFSVSKEMIAKGAYWILMKFNADKFKQYINKLSTENFCGYTVDKCVNLYIIPFYVRFTFLGRMQKNS